MFYDNLKYVCEKNKLKITPVVVECGGARGSITNWKNGAMPNSDIVAKLSVRLNVSCDFLIFGEEKFLPLTSDEQELVNSYRELSIEKRSFLKGQLHTLITFNDKDEKKTEE